MVTPYYFEKKKPRNLDNNGVDSTLAFLLVMLGGGKPLLIMFPS